MRCAGVGKLLEQLHGLFVFLGAYIIFTESYGRLGAGERLRIFGKAAQGCQSLTGIPAGIELTLGQIIVGFIGIVGAQAAGIQVILFDRTIEADESLYVSSVVSDVPLQGERAVQWLADQGLEEYNIIHIQGVMGSSAQVGRTGALDEMVAANDNWNLVTQQTAEWNAETAQQIVQSVIDSGKEFNVIYAENDDMARGAVAALDKANISHGVDGDVIIMGFDCNKWALEELLAGNWNYDGQANPFQADTINEIIQGLENGEQPEKVIYLEERGFDAATITQEDIDTYGI